MSALYLRADIRHVHLSEKLITAISQEPSSKSLDQWVIAEVVEHNKREGYRPGKTPGGYPPTNSSCVMYRFIYLYLLKGP